MADKVGEEFGAGVALFDVVFCEDFVGEVGAGFEGEFFGEDEGVVAVEEEVGYLGDWRWLVVGWGDGGEGGRMYFGHDGGGGISGRGVCRIRAIKIFV